MTSAIVSHSSSQNKRERLLYFSAVDGGIEHSIREKEFMRSLVYNLLLEPDGLLITDVFFFNCVHLIKLAERRRYSLFTRALEKGLVVPAFRYPDTSSFSKALSDIGGLSVLGIEEKQFQDSPQDLAEWLDDCYGKANQKPPLIWPAEMGVAFGERVQSVFLNDAPAGVDSRIQEMWSKIRNLREASLEDARDVTRRLAGGGIRRAEIFNALGWNLGLLDRGEVYPKPRDLLADARRKGRTVASQAKLLIDVVNVCYQRSQTDRFNDHEDSNYSVLLNVPAPLVKGATVVLPELNVSGPMGDVAPEVFERTVRMPTVETLLRADSRNLIAIREGEKALEYFDRRREWVAKPSEANRERLADALDAYVEKITDFASGPQQEARVSILQKAAVGTLIAAASQTTSFMMEQGGLSAHSRLIGSIGVGAGVSVLTVLTRRPYVPKTRYNVRVESTSVLPEMNISAAAPSA